MSFKPKDALVWCEIPVTDMDAAKAFYEAVFTYELTVDTTGPNPMMPLPHAENGVVGHIYPGKPAGNGQGPTVHLQSPDSLEAALARCKEAGGEVISDPIPLPAGRFAYILDLDGNSIGLFEPQAA
jgi:predicted enzyme related to lactoylglutathione lyase